MLKYILSCSIILCLSIALLAQEKENNLLIGADISYSRSVMQDPNTRVSDNFFLVDPTPITNEYLESSSLFGSLKFGQIINPKITYGIILSYRKTSRINKVTDEGDVDLTLYKFDSQDFQIGLFYRQSFLNKSKFTPFVQPSISYLNSSDDSFYGLLTFDRITKNKDLAVSLNLGLIYSIDNKWNILLQLPAGQYQMNLSSDTEYPEDPDTITRIETIEDNNFSLGLDLRRIQIGVERLF